MRALLISLILLLAAPVRADRRNLKVAGIVCTLVGAGLTITGIALIGASYVDEGPRPYVPHGDLRHGGIGVLVMGLVGMGVGIPLWVIGSQGGRRASLVPAVGRDSATVGLALSF